MSIKKDNKPYQDDRRSDETEHEEPGKLEGKNAVMEALKANHPINRIYLEKESRDPLLGKIYAIARDKGFVVTYLDKNRMDQMSSARGHQGVIAEIASYHYAQIDEVLERADKLDQPPLLLILDGITDPNNLGAVIRSAECAGVHGIVLPKRRSAALTPVVAKVAAGAVEYVPVVRVTNLTRTIQDMKKRGIWVIGADPQGETFYDRYDYSGATAIVIGSEGEGISRLIRENCDQMIKIPMYGRINSLNAATAASLIVFHASRKREEAGIIVSREIHG